MTVYRSVLYYCDHKHAGRMCSNKAIGLDDNIAGELTRNAGWLFTDEGDFCPSHRADHQPAKPQKVRAVRAPAAQATLDELADGAP